MKNVLEVSSWPPKLYGSVKTPGEGPGFLRDLGALTTSAAGSLRSGGQQQILEMGAGAACGV